MLKFEEKELGWIKNELTYVLAEENKECVEYVDDEDIAKARTVRDNIELVNTNEVINEMCLDSLFNVLGMWVWGERLDDPMNQIDNYVEDKMYCNIYRKLKQYFVEEEEN